MTGDLKILLIDDNLGALSTMVQAELAARELEVLQFDPLVVELDRHEHVREHLEVIYRSHFDALLDRYARRAHLRFMEDPADVAAVLLLLFGDEFAHDFELTLTQAGAEAYGYAEPALGAKPWGQLSERSLAFSESRVPDLGNVPVEVLKRLRTEIQEAVLEKQSPLALTRRFDEAIRRVKEVEGERMASTESQVVYGTAQDNALKAVGFTHKRWVSVGDERVRESHRQCHEQGAILINKPFINGLRYPGDPSGPPEEIINCRCKLVGENLKEGEA